MALITLEEYKTLNKITKTEEDEVLQMLIDNVSAIIQSYIGRPLWDTGEVYEDVIDIDYETNSIYLEHYPVTELLEVTQIDPSYYDSSVHFPVVLSTLVLDKKNGKLIRTGHRSIWPQGFGAVIVRYSAGAYDASTIPLELKQAASDLVKYYKNEEYKDSKSMRGATINNNTGSGNSNSPSTNFPPHIQRVLDLYK